MGCGGLSAVASRVGPWVSVIWGTGTAGREARRGEGTVLLSVSTAGPHPFLLKGISNFENRAAILACGQRKDLHALCSDCGSLSLGPGT